MSRNVVDQIISRDGLDIVGGSQYSPAQRCALVGNRVQVVEDNLFNLLLNFLHFSEDDPSLSVNLTLSESRVLDYVSQNINSYRGVIDVYQNTA